MWMQQTYANEFGFSEHCIKYIMEYPILVTYS